MNPLIVLMLLTFVLPLVLVVLFELTEPTMFDTIPLSWANAALLVIVGAWLLMAATWR